MLFVFALTAAAARPPIELAFPPSQRSVDGWLNTTLIIDVITFAPVGGPSIWQTRSINGTLPGPTLYIKAGDRIRIQIQNRLGPDVVFPNDTTWNTWNVEINTTNFHTHGLHTSPQFYADNVLRHIAAGTTSFVDLYIHPLHAPGTFWYHPHVHGSTQAAILSGMGGFMIIEDEAPNFPPSLAAMRDVPLALCHLDVSPTGDVFDVLGPPLGKFGNYLPLNLRPNPGFSPPDPPQENPQNWVYVNGQYAPTLRARPGEFVRLRLLSVIAFDYIQPAIPGCEVLQIAIDGVYLPAPRLMPRFVLVSGSRLDWAVRCNAPGTYHFGPQDASAYPSAEVLYTGNQTLMYLVVEGTPINWEATYGPLVLPSLAPYPYLIPLSAVPDDEVAKNITILWDNLEYNLQAFPTSLTGFRALNSTSTEPSELELSAATEMSLVQTDVGGASTQSHPYHIHTNNFEMHGSAVGIPGFPYDEIFYKPGDIRDTVPSAEVPFHMGVNFSRITFRYFADTYLATGQSTGALVTHCHRVVHEDEGFMALMTINTTLTQTIRASVDFDRVANSPSNNPCAPGATFGPGGGTVVSVPPSIPTGPRQQNVYQLASAATSYFSVTPADAQFASRGSLSWWYFHPGELVVGSRTTLAVLGGDPTLNSGDWVVTMTVVGPTTVDFNLTVGGVNVGLRESLVPLLPVGGGNWFFVSVAWQAATYVRLFSAYTYRARGAFVSVDTPAFTARPSATVSLRGAAGSSVDEVVAFARGMNRFQMADVLQSRALLYANGAQPALTLVFPLAEGQGAVAQQYGFYPPEAVLNSPCERDAYKQCFNSTIVAPSWVQASVPVVAANGTAIQLLPNGGGSYLSFGYVVPSEGGVSVMLLTPAAADGTTTLFSAGSWGLTLNATAVSFSLSAAGPAAVCAAPSAGAWHAVTAAWQRRGACAALFLYVDSQPCAAVDSPWIEPGATVRYGAPGSTRRQGAERPLWDVADHAAAAGARQHHPPGHRHKHRGPTGRKLRPASHGELPSGAALSGEAAAAGRRASIPANAALLSTALFINSGPPAPADVLNLNQVFSLCGGVAATDPAVCSGNGVCVGPDVCQCAPGRFGPTCNSTTAPPPPPPPLVPPVETGKASRKGLLGLLGLLGLIPLAVCLACVCGVLLRRRRVMGAVKFGTFDAAAAGPATAMSVVPMPMHPVAHPGVGTYGPAVSFAP